jgi:hypothetical protein
MNLADFPILLNARDDAGRTIYADGRGGAYVQVPHPEGHLPFPPPPSGTYFGTTPCVRRPASMRDRFFDEHPHSAIYANEARTECVVVPNGGNPPPPILQMPLPATLR